MKITLRQLKNLIREAVMSASAARSAGLALCKTVDESEMTQLVVYRPATLRGVVSVIVGTADAEGLASLLIPYARASIVGAIRGEDIEGVTSITRVFSSQEGLGPLLYDFMSAERGWITPDPYKTSQDAVRVWDFYKSSRKDVDIKKSPIHGDGTEVAMIKLKDPSSARAGIKSLEESHDMAVNNLMRELRPYMGAESSIKIYNTIVKTIDNVSNDELENRMPG